MGPLKDSVQVGVVRCPAHDDHTPSFAVYHDGHGYCFVCHHYDPHYTGPIALPEPQRRGYRGPLPWGMAEAYARLLWGPFRHRLGFLVGRGLRRMTIEKLRLGHTGRHFTIPIWDHTGLITIKYRRDDRLDPEGPKYRGLPGAKATLYGAWQFLAEKVVLLCEGELDAARLMQELWLHNEDGVVALAITNGCGGLTVALAKSIFMRGAERVVLVYDQDAPGRAAMHKAYEDVKAQGCLGQAMWRGDMWGKDVTEAINTVGFETWWQTAIKPNLS